MSAISDISKYTLYDFDGDAALSGVLIFAMRTVLDGVQYYPVSNFKLNPGEKYPSCRYIGLVEDVWRYFNDLGQDVHRVYTLKLATSLIVGGNGVGNVVTKADPTSPGEYVHYTLSQLNYRETIAMKVLGFLINNIENPDNLTDAKITYLISSAFRVSYEFVNQAVDLRNNNSEIEEQEEQAVTDPSAAMSEQTFWNLLLKVFDKMYGVNNDETPKNPIQFSSKALKDSIDALKTTINKMYSASTPVQVAGNGGGGGGGGTDLTQLIATFNKMYSASTPVQVELINSAILMLAGYPFAYKSLEYSTIIQNTLGVIEFVTKSGSTAKKILELGDALITCLGDLIPDVAYTRNLGSDTKSWNNLYIDKILLTNYNGEQNHGLDPFYLLHLLIDTNATNVEPQLQQDLLNLNDIGITLEQYNDIISGYITRLVDDSDDPENGDLLNVVGVRTSTSDSGDKVTIDIGTKYKLHQVIYGGSLTSVTDRVFWIEVLN